MYRLSRLIYIPNWFICMSVFGRRLKPCVGTIIFQLSLFNGE